MIIEGVFNDIYSIFELLFGWITLPDFPESFKNSVNTYLGYIFNNLQLIYLFIRPVTLKTAVPILVAILNFDKLYKLVMYVVKKIPFVNIK